MGSLPSSISPASEYWLSLGRVLGWYWGLMQSWSPWGKIHVSTGIWSGMGLTNDRPHANQVSTREASLLIFIRIVMLTLDPRIPSIHISCTFMWENKYSGNKWGLGPALPFSCHITLAKYLCTQSLDFLIYRPEVIITFYQTHRTFWKRREGHACGSCVKVVHDLKCSAPMSHPGPMSYQTYLSTNAHSSQCVCLYKCVCVCECACVLHVIVAHWKQRLLPSSPNTTQGHTGLLHTVMLEWNHGIPEMAGALPRQLVFSLC